MSEAAPSRWWSEWKAGLVILALEIWMIFALVIYFEVLTGIRIMPKSVYNPNGIIIFTSLLLINWRLLFHNDRWKTEIDKFKNWPKEKNRKGSILVFGFVLIVITSLVFAFYLLSQTTHSIS